MICKKQTCVMVSQFIDMESDNFHGRLPSNKIPETGFHQQTVKTVAYLRVSTAQQDAGSQRLAILGVRPQARLPHRRLYRSGPPRDGPPKPAAGSMS